MSRPSVPRSYAKRMKELIRTFNLKKGGTEDSSADEEEMEDWCSNDLGRKGQISSANSFNASSPGPESTDEKEAALIGRLEELIKTFNLDEWVHNESWNMEENGERVKAWIQALH